MQNSNNNQIFVMTIGITITPTIINRINIIQHIFYIQIKVPFDFFYATSFQTPVSTDLSTYDHGLQSKPLL